MNRNTVKSLIDIDSFASIAFVIVIAIAQFGCQPLGNRWRSQTTALDSANDDDWARPRVNAYSAPQRYPKHYKSGTSEASTEEKSMARSTLSDKSTGDKNPGDKNAVDKSLLADNRPPSGRQISGKLSDRHQAEDGSPGTKIVTESTSRKQSTSKNNSNTAVATDSQDLDLEGAMASVPPNLRLILQRQLEAIENGDYKNNESVDKELTNSDTKIVSAPSKKVSRKISDVDDDDFVNPAPSSSQPEPMALAKGPSNKTIANSEVQTASAVTSEQANDKSQVVTASATSPADAVSQASSVSPVAPVLPATSLLWNHDLSESIQKLEKQLKENPIADENLRLSQEMTLRMLYVANRQLEEAMRPIEGLTDAERDYFRHQAQALFEASNPDAMPVKSRKWSLVMNSQRAATDQLASVSNLDVKSVAFCTDVQGYGVVNKFPSYAFRPDQDLLLYCELDNVAAQAVKDGYETQLQGSYEIIDPNGRRIADQLLPMEREICKNHRRDYFIVYRIYTPMQIGPGNYQLRLTVEDMKAKKFGQATLDFQIQK